MRRAAETTSARKLTITAAAVGRGQGGMNLVGGLWPLVSPRSFEKVFGHKHDTWLQYTVAGLLAGIGWTQLWAANSPEGLRHARRIGVSSATVLLAVDLIYAPGGRIRRTYLLDAAMEAGWLAAWALSARSPRSSAGDAPPSP